MVELAEDRRCDRNISLCWNGWSVRPYTYSISVSTSYPLVALSPHGLLCREGRDLAHEITEAEVEHEKL